jgi:excisionase family DNA binding protein
MERPERAAFTIGEVAVRLGVCNTTIRRRISDQTIRVVRLGPKVLISACELQRLLGEEQRLTEPRQA